MDEENFNNELENILNKIKQMIENQDFDNMPNVDPEQLEQLKMFMSQFDELKDELKVEIFKLDPFTKQLVSAFMGKLGNMDFQTSNPAKPTTPETAPNKEVELKDIPGTNENYSSQLVEIDKKLRNTQLNDDQINELLDRRAEIMAKMKP
ncbi:MAG: hypothetical protein MJZ94_01680 [Bacteroidales bacterium]|nr:hypothetical protein [Bacteroidales bacterium]